MKNYYQIIGVDSTASQDTIKHAYLLKLKKYHPDVYSGDKAFAQAKTTDLNEAYEILKDEQKRAEYDKKIKLNEPKKETLKDRWQKFRELLKQYKQMFGRKTSSNKKKKKEKQKLTKEQQQEKNDKKKLTALIFGTLVAIVVILLIMLL